MAQVGDLFDAEHREYKLEIINKIKKNVDYIRASDAIDIFQAKSILFTVANDLIKLREKIKND